MKSQFYADLGGSLAMQGGQAVRLDGRRGEVIVRSGRVWLTRRGDLDDHVLEAGQRAELRASDEVVIEPWQANERAVVDWRPAQRRVDDLPRGAAAFGLRGVAAGADAVASGLRRAAGGFATLARNAASMARRAQGCI